ncbi:hypothetical protein HPB48_005856 [Haemaphysalis longicornis]|uniref:Uncharacterized protein n=1 Tax=Haemaphysalis longicornis TaxID=44386 RepID=A0A9J6GM07_HAELO|nr:hypothetical protein HPB48_005856 [Haemaphysalis longicornis]
MRTRTASFQKFATTLTSLETSRWDMVAVGSDGCYTNPGLMKGTAAGPAGRRHLAKPSDETRCVAIYPIYSFLRSLDDACALSFPHLTIKLEAPPGGYAYRRRCAAAR